jgi:crossover junction endodeoxyribonuclease RuvC
MVVIGIDPGATGAIAKLVDGKLVDVRDMPTITERKGRRRIDGAALAHLLSGMGGDLVYVEQANAMPRQGVSSTFAFGMAYGIVLGVVGALEMSLVPVTPTAWKTSLRVPSAKDAARERASQLLPEGASFWPLVKHHGRAESALIGFYGTNQEVRQKGKNVMEW